MFNNDPNDWHVSLHFSSAQFAEKTIELQGDFVNAVEVQADQLRAAFPAKFDEFIQSINKLDGGYAEGDGSYGVVGPGGSWKICGNIYENIDAIQYVELLGKCPTQQLTQFVGLLGCRPEQCTFQNMRGGYFQSFNQFIASDS